VDCIVYGHTHRPSREERKGILFFNPGSFGRGLGTTPKSFGLLTPAHSISGEILYL